VWSNFFAAASSASATLAGLVFVALSVNIKNVLNAEHLPSRAGATIGSLMLILVCSIASLIPQSRAALGCEVLAFVAGGWWLQFRSAVRGFVVGARLKRPRWEAILNATLGHLEILPFFLAGVLLIAGRASSLYWLAGGCIFVLIVSVLNAWVLLVEILR
jgi:modulator of FtsH protease